MAAWSWQLLQGSGDRTGGQRFEWLFSFMLALFVDARFPGNAPQPNAYRLRRSV